MARNLTPRKSNFSLLCLHLAILPIFKKNICLVHLLDIATMDYTELKLLKALSSVSTHYYVWAIFYALLTLSDPHISYLTNQRYVCQSKCSHQFLTEIWAYSFFTCLGWCNNPFKDTRWCNREREERLWKANFGGAVNMPTWDPYGQTSGAPHGKRLCRPHEDLAKMPLWVPHGRFYPLKMHPKPTCAP